MEEKFYFQYDELEQLNQALNAYLADFPDLNNYQDYAQKIAACPKPLRAYIRAQEGLVMDRYLPYARARFYLMLSLCAIAGEIYCNHLRNMSVRQLKYVFGVPMGQEEFDQIKDRKLAKEKRKSWLHAYRAVNIAFKRAKFEVKDPLLRRYLNLLVQYLLRDLSIDYDRLLMSVDGCYFSETDFSKDEVQIYQDWFEQMQLPHFKSLIIHKPHTYDAVSYAYLCQK